MTEAAIPSKPRKSYLSKKSMKAPAVQTAVVTRRALGQSKAQISQEVGIAKNTVSSIIEQSEIDRILEDQTLSCAKLLPKCVREVDYHLDRHSLTAALSLLTPMVLNRDTAINASQVGNMHISQTIQMLLHPDKPAEPVKATETIIESTATPTDTKT